MIKLFPNYASEMKLVSINLKEGKADSPFDAETRFVPSSNGGYDVFVNTSDFKWYQNAARTIASLGCFSIRLTSDVKLSPNEFYWFVTALYDGIHDISIEYDLAAEELSKVESMANLVSKFRAIADTDSKISTPTSVVKALFEEIESAASECGAKASLTLIKRGDKDFESCTGLKAVGLASDEDPCMGIIDVIPSNLDEKAPLDVAMVGKGITFDTGGYSLKPEKFMETMRTDKTAVIYLSGALCLALKLGLKRRCRLYLCCSENMVYGRGMLPGDIIKYPNDISVEINNTDAEGRLVLADGLLKASNDNPAFILDMATLTGAAKVAVGRDMFSVLTREATLDEKLKSSFDECGEMYWQLPLAPYHRRFLSSRRAAVTNSGHGEGAPGSSVAASFLEQFVKKDIPWVHIDLSSAYLPDGSPFLAAGPSGSTILGLATWLCTR